MSLVLDPTSSSAVPTQVRVTAAGAGDLWLATEVPQWLRNLAKDLSGLAALPEFWDGEKASRISDRAVLAALRALMEAMSADTPTPSIVPTTSGGLQLEWHPARHVDIEVYVEADGSISGWGRLGGAEWETDVLPASGLRDRLAELAALAT